MSVAGLTGALASVLALAGCASLPPAELAGARRTAAAFEARLAERFQLTNSVVFRLRGREIAGLGLVKVDRADRSFVLVCLNPLGVKLFELRGRGDDVECASGLEVFTAKGDFARAVAGDVRRAYFDTIPPAGATVGARGGTIVFRQPTAPGCVEYVFDRAGVLREKRFRAGLRRVWSVRYGYQEQAGTLIPTGIVVDNSRHGYRLTVRPLRGESRP